MGSKKFFRLVILLCICLKNINLNFIEINQILFKSFDLLFDLLAFNFKEVRFDEDLK